MNNSEYNDLFDLGIKIKNEGVKFRKLGNTEMANKEFFKAIKIFEQLYPLEFQPDKFNKSFILGGLYRWTENYKKAFEMFSTATMLNTDSESASLNLYLTYVELDESHNAIGELERYLTSHSANLYKDTLLELLEEIKDGRLPLYKERIFILARRNAVI